MRFPGVSRNRYDPRRPGSTTKHGRGLQTICRTLRFFELMEIEVSRRVEVRLVVFRFFPRHRSLVEEIRIYDQACARHSCCDST
jgi:hypothetical protein